MTDATHTKTRGTAGSKAYKWLLLIIIFLLPLQTRWIFDAGTIDSAAFEYMTWSLYTVEVLIAIAALLSPPNRFQRKAGIGLLLAFVGWVVISTLFSGFTGSSMLPHFAMAALFGVLILYSGLKILRVAWAVVGSGVVQAIFVLVQVMMQRVVASKWLGVAEHLPENLGVSVVEVDALRILRGYGLLPHPNIAAGFLVIAIIFGIGLLIYKHNRWVLVPSLAVMTTGLALTYSRSALLGLAVALAGISVVMGIWHKKRRHRLLLGLAAIFTPLACCIIFTHDAWFTRMSTNQRLEEQSINERQLSYEDGLALTQAYFPFGVGYGNVPIALSELFPERDPWSYAPTHNIYLLMLAELGVVGLGLFGALIISAFRGINRLKPWSVVVSSALGALLVIGWFDHYLFSLWPGLLLFFFTWALTQAINKKSRRITS